MRKDDLQIVSKLMMTLLFIVITNFFLLTNNIQAQDAKPYNKAEILRILGQMRKDQSITPSEFIGYIKQNGVDFRMSNVEEKEIRLAGKHLEANTLNELLDAIRRIRLRVTLFKYTCDTDQFTELLDSQLSTLVGTISTDSRSEYVARLKVVKESSRSMSIEDYNQYWKTTLSLQVLNGACLKEDGNVFVVSKVFLGNLKGSLGNPILIRSKIDPSEYMYAKDIHSLLILYSLAREAQERGVSKEIIIGYLVKARVLASELKYSDRQSLQPIKDAIENMLRELKVNDLYTLPVK